MQAAHPENSQEFRGYSPPGTEDVGSLDPWAARPDGGKPAAKDSPEEEKGILDLTVSTLISHIPSPCCATSCKKRDGDNSLIGDLPLSQGNIQHRQRLQ